MFLSLKFLTFFKKGFLITSKIIVFSNQCFFQASYIAWVLWLYFNILISFFVINQTILSFICYCLLWTFSFMVSIVIVFVLILFEETFIAQRYRKIFFWMRSLSIEVLKKNRVLSRKKAHSSANTRRLRRVPNKLIKILLFIEYIWSFIWPNTT